MWALIALGALVEAACVDARALVRQGRLYEACNRTYGGGPEDRRAVFDELRRRAPARLLVHVSTGGADASGAELPAVRAGYLATQTLVLDGAAGASPRVVLMVDPPDLASAEHSAAGWRFNDQMDERLAYAMLTGREVRAANASVAGLMVDTVSLVLSVGVIDPRLRGDWSVSTASRERVPVAELLSRFTRPDTPRWNCEAEPGNHCTKLLALTRTERSEPAERLTMGFYWRIYSGEDACVLRRDVDVALAPGSDIASRINATFARGPLDVYELPERLR